MMQTKKTVMLVLLSIVIVITQLPRANMAGQRQDSDDVLDQGKSNCTSKCEMIEATPIVKALSITGCIGSAIVIIYPAGVRVSKRIDGNNIVKDQWFMAFLGIVTIDYILWARYSLQHCHCDATIYVLISSILGAAVSALYFLIGLVTDVRRVTNQIDKRAFPLMFIVMGMLSLFDDAVNGYVVMICTIIAHICRVLGTDYTCFSGAQCTVSLIGLISGFLSFQHPHLFKDQPFQITSIVVAVVRGLELGWWLLSLPKARHWLQGRKEKFDHWCASIRDS